MAVSRSLDARTLPQWLRARAEGSGTATALRHKRRGLWHTESWSELLASVQATAGALREHGLSADDELLVDAPAAPAVLRWCLAAWWLGAHVATIEPDATLQADAALPRPRRSRFALAGSEAGLAKLEAAHGPEPLALGIVLDGETARVRRGASGSLSPLSTSGSSSHLVAPSGAAEHLALLRHGARARGGPCSPQTPAGLSHAALIESARGVVGPSALEAGESFAGGALSLGDRLEFQLGAWLLAGSSLSFAETSETEHADRREIAPTWLWDTAEGYAALAARIEAHLPPGSSRERRWVDGILGGRGTRLAQRFVTSRLRSITGLSRVRRAVVIGGAASAAPSIERLLGVSLLEWPARGAARGEGSPRPSDAPLGALELARTGSDAE